MKEEIMNCTFGLRSIAILSGLLLTASPASAATINASSSGYGLFVSAAALTLNLNAGPSPNAATGTAPAPYNLADSALAVNVTSSIPFVVSGQAAANSVNGTATSNVDGLPGSRLTTASGGVDGAQIGLNTIPILGGGITLLGINATLNSTAQITGDFGSLAASGTTTIQNLGLTINAIPVNLTAFVGVNVAPNTSVNLALLGIANSSLILNEQLIAPNQTSIIVNAFHLTVNLASLIAADVVLGHSQVAVTAVPEPATLAFMGLALVPLTCFARSARRRWRVHTQPLQPTTAI
jgi:hypothetical protein